MNVAVCFACNEAYIPLCKGLVLSIHGTRRFLPKNVELSLHFIDVGCTPASLGWMEEKQVALHSFCRADYPALATQQLAPRYADAQFCRPFLPQLVPGHDCYIWIDSDIWIQSSEALPALIQAATAWPNQIAICPEYHYGYMGHRNQRNAIVAHKLWYMALYRDEEMATEYSYLPMFNTGLFAMTGANPLWQAWAEELGRLYAADYSTDPSVLHYAEQIGLNRVAYSRNALTPLDPIFNYACGGSAAHVDSRGKVVVGYPPHTPLKGVHLLCFSKYGAMYVEKGFLYRQGTYLTPEERASLLALTR